MLARFSFRQFKASAARDDNLTMVDIILQEGLERQCARLLIDQRQHIRVKGALHGSVFEERIENAVGIGIALELDHYAHTLAIRFVAYFRDTFYLPITG